MSHEVETMMYAGEVPWHGLGKAVGTEKTAKDAIVLAGLDWENELQPIFLKGKNVIDGIPVIGDQVPERQAVVRKTDGSILGVVGPNYEIIQNVDCFNFLDDVIGEGQAVYHTAGSLFQGRRIFITIKLNEDMLIGQDKINKFLLLAAGHDGTMAVHVKFTPIRVVCNNTLSMALNVKVEAGKRKQIQDTFRIKHTGNFRDRVSECREALKLADYYYKYMGEQFNRMLDQQFSQSDFEKFTLNLLPNPVSKDGEEKESKRRQKTRDALVKIFTEDTTTKDVRNTKWAAFNAVTTFVDHNRPTRIKEGKEEADVRFDTILYKGGKELREKAYELLTA